MDNDDFYQALFSSHPKDIEKIRRYVKWVKFRRHVHSLFYPIAHWVKAEKKYHWVGRH